MSCPELRDPRSLRITQNRTNWRLSLTVIGHCLLSPLEEVGACIIHEGKEASAFNVVKSRYDTVFQHKKGPHEERYHTTECSI